MVLSPGVAQEISRIHYVANRRLVVDKGVVATTGAIASMPTALTLIEAIAGRDKAQAVGQIST
jgi:transcriptional regulator GlxA family with amidase domain